MILDGVECSLLTVYCCLGLRSYPHTQENFKMSTDQFSRQRRVTRDGHIGQAERRDRHARTHARTHTLELRVVLFLLLFSSSFFLRNLTFSCFDQTMTK